jgi:hypothetical protein
MDAGERGAGASRPPGTWDMVARLEDQREFSARTFGPPPRFGSVIAHLRKEVDEIEADPEGLEEWVDVWILALDGMWRGGWTNAEITAAIDGKMEINRIRTWPDWRTVEPGAPMEHLRALPEPTP